jgi:hypothetical protein
MHQKTSAVNLLNGLNLLMGKGQTMYLRGIYKNCFRYFHCGQTHPFGLDLPKGKTIADVKFVDPGATDMVVEALVLCIREWVNEDKDTTIEKLRVINLPNGQEQGQNYVFFEFWSMDKVFVSGKTTDFSSGGNEARRELEDVFAVIAITHNLTIERVQLDEKQIEKIGKRYR